MRENKTGGVEQRNKISQQFQLEISVLGSQ